MWLSERFDASDELCDFLNLPHGSKTTFRHVRTKLEKYINDHSLLHREKYRLDPTLKRLFKYNDETEEVSRLLSKESF